MYYPDEDLLYQLSDTEDSSDGFPEQTFTKVPSRKNPQVAHTLKHNYSLHTSGPKLQNTV